MRRAGVEQDVNDEGNPTRQRWKIEPLEKVTVDFLIQPSLPDDKGGKLRDIEPDFAAVIVPGLHLAFQDREHILREGKTIMGKYAKRSDCVCERSGACVGVGPMHDNAHATGRQALVVDAGLRDNADS